MTKEELAKLLDGGEYGSVPTAKHVNLASKNDLVIVYGYSDDCCEFDGVISDEASCYGGGVIHFDEEGFVLDWDEIIGDMPEQDDVKRWFERDRLKKTITATWDDGEYSWTYETDLPHATFEIVEDGEKYCRGIVIDMKDVRG